MSILGKVELPSSYRDELWKPVSSMVVRCVHCGSAANFTGTAEELNKAAQEFFALHDDKNHQRKRVTKDE